MSAEGEGIIDSLTDCSDAILGIREDIGAGLKKVYFVTRTWAGGKVGQGAAKDTQELMMKTPYLVDLSKNYRALEAGVVKQGDILLKMVSKNRYPDRAKLESTNESTGVQHFYCVGDALYLCITVRERYLQWDIHLRPLSDQRKYP